MNVAPVLAISGSNVTGDAPFSCALAVGDRLVAASSPPGQRGDLAGLAADVCARAGVARGDVHTLRIDLGPGSYTGLRVAVTFARSLQRFAGVRVFATDSLSLLAAASQIAGRRIRPLLDARRERVHTAALRHDARGVLAIDEPPRAVPLGEVVASIRAEDVFVVPDTAPPAFGEALRHAGAEVVGARGVTASDLFATALVLVACDHAALEPRYLMGSYAE